MTQPANIMKPLASMLQYSLNVGWNVVDLGAVLVCHDHAFSSSGVGSKNNPILDKTKNMTLYTPSLNKFGIQVCSTLVHWKMDFKLLFKDIQNIKTITTILQHWGYFCNGEGKQSLLMMLLTFKCLSFTGSLPLLNHWLPLWLQQTKFLLAAIWVEALRSGPH